LKKRILNLGLSATHSLITPLPGPNDVLSISDFDAFVLEPSSLLNNAISAESYHRRQREIRDLVVQKGGVAICIVRPAAHLAMPWGGVPPDQYSVFDLAASPALDLIRNNLRAGWGSHVEVVPTAKGPAAAYFRVLQGLLRFAAYVETIASDLEYVEGTVFAVDSVQHPIGFEVKAGAGRICFLPVPDGATGDRVGSAIARLVEAHYGGPGEIEVPAWAVEIAVPGATAHDAKILELEARRTQLEEEVSCLKENRAALLNFRALLYAYGRSMLEPVVRSALGVLGFRVPEPEDYAGEWDVELYESESSAAAIGEVEGSEGVIDVDKFRQLLNYVTDEALEGRDHKGILIGNGYRLTAPEAPERQKQFSEHTLRGAKKNAFCLLPTTELFKAVCAVLEAPEDEGLKIMIRDSILSTVGVWAFAREVATSQESAAGSAAG